ncbi:hypothetical protein Taro_019146 [Colocasia esculenta]|uniref:Uncharacterized protein n=1 Tax=Colocasia esculenta TaxID=4460 RepID=A0A843V1B9_COLES|nr:hypothetical protein [Colocasia esculenta]
MVLRQSLNGLWNHDSIRDRVFTVFNSCCTRGTSASFLVRSYTSHSLGARHLRACPVREVVTVVWDPHPRTPVEGVLQVAGVLKSQTLECGGKNGETSQQRQGARRAEEEGQ